MGSTLPPTFWELVVQAAKEQPDAPVVSDDHGRSLTRTQLRDAAEATAAALSARGVRPDTVVSWQLPTTIEAAVLLVALARIGAVQNPLIPILREREVSFITQQVGTRAAHRAGGVARLSARGHGAGPCHFRWFRGDGDRSARAEHSWIPTGPPSADRRPEQLGALPIAIHRRSPLDLLLVRHHRRPQGRPPYGHQHHVLVQRLARTHGIRRGRCLSNPLADHAHRWRVRPGIKHSRRGPPRPLRDLRPCGDPPPDGPLRAHGAGHSRPILPGVPGRRAREQRRGTLSQPCGSELSAVPPFPPRSTTKCGRCSACPSSAAGGSPSSPTPRPRHPMTLWRSSRRRLDGRRRASRCAPSTRRETSAQQGQEGELLLRGPQCFSGYVDPTLDEASFDADGWFHTGDLGTIDAAGNVRITGRLKDIIIRNAENISVVEVEEMLYRHPAVADAAVLGLTRHTHGRAGRGRCGAPGGMPSGAERYP